jgi:indole-3-glycerol phosphate synthase
VATYLDRILDVHRSRAAADPRPLAALVESAGRCPPARPFAEALRQAAGPAGSLAVIAEIKRRSPSKGPLNPDLDPERVARNYEEGGAAALSVLTEREFFGGSPADLAAARDATALPVLRKDFTVSALDVCDARLMGADCVLLIVAAVTQPELLELHALAREIGLDALVEVHDEAELQRAVEAGADLIGVNQRDLVTFEVDQRRAARMAPLIPDGAVRVAESGVRGPADARELHDAGYHAVLVGEGLVTAPDPASAVRGMVQMTELTGGS